VLRVFGKLLAPGAESIDTELAWYAHLAMQRGQGLGGCVVHGGDVAEFQPEVASPGIEVRVGRGRYQGGGIGVEPAADEEFGAAGVLAHGGDRRAGHIDVLGLGSRRHGAPRSSGRQSGTDSPGRWAPYPARGAFRARNLSCVAERPVTFRRRRGKPIRTCSVIAAVIAAGVAARLQMSRTAALGRYWSSRSFEVHL
jgi:hypothetical protein